MIGKENYFFVGVLYLHIFENEIRVLIKRNIAFSMRNYTGVFATTSFTVILILTVITFTVSPCLYTFYLLYNVPSHSKLINGGTVFLIS